MEQVALFYEKQTMDQVSLVIGLCFVNCLLIFLLIKAIKAGNKLNVAGMIFGLAVTLLTTLLILNIRLETQIKQDGVYVKLFPFNLKYQHYTWKQLTKAYTRTYSPVQEYGGWGQKGTAENQALNISGNQGLQLIFTNGHKLLIGTQKPKEITELLIKLGENQK